MAGPGRLGFGGVLIVIAAFVVAQSVVHLVVVLLFHRMETFVDLDRSNGLPDIVSTVALALAALGAGAVARHERGSQRLAATVLAAVLAVLVLASSFFVTGLDRLDHRFERARGERTAEYQIVAKEGLELLGWSLVALALWDEALRLRRSLVTVPTARASRAPAPSRRRAA